MGVQARVPTSDRLLINLASRERDEWSYIFLHFPPLHFADCENFTRLPLGAGLSKVTTEFPSVPLNTMQVQSSESERGADRSQCRTHLASCAE